MIRRTDKKGRACLPRSFANASVLIEQVSAMELRIRKVQVVREDEYRFPEATAILLSDRDRDLFLELLDNPPPASRALRRAAAKYKKGHG